MLMMPKMKTTLRVMMAVLTPPSLIMLEKDSTNPGANFSPPSIAQNTPKIIRTMVFSEDRFLLNQLSRATSKYIVPSYATGVAPVFGLVLSVVWISC